MRRRAATSVFGELPVEEEESPSLPKGDCELRFVPRLAAAAARVPCSGRVSVAGCRAVCESDDIARAIDDEEGFEWGEPPRSFSSCSALNQ